jgi:hypothetical protein
MLAKCEQHVDGRVRARRLTYDQVACENLQDLGSQASSTSKHSLKDRNENVTQRRAHEGTIHCHLGHARCEVMSILVLVVGDP